MQAECPHCHTLFRVTETQLDMADGMVRCGYCKEVFNARDVNDAQDNESQPDSREVPFGAGSDAGSYSMLATVSWSLAILLLIATLAAEYIWFNHPELLQELGKTTLVAELVRTHPSNGLRTDDPDAVELAFLKHHLGEPDVVGGGRYETASTREELGFGRVAPVHGGIHELQAVRRSHVVVDEPIALPLGHPESRVIHAERFEDPLMQEDVERLARGDLDDPSQDIGRHAVVPHRAWRGQQR